ncbi:MAG: hypothetical protein B6D59_04435 [Campylobacteraceae bacterium 4484_4]|nr:MAG: hypothetical protein B6D59_04435 [Campylobacteraceae bacterium 4484_4]
MIRLLSLVFSLFLLINGCGYKPTVVYTKEILGDRIYAEVETSLEDPENSVLIKDALREAVLNRFRSKLVRKDLATSTIYMKLNKVTFMPIQYDRNGYVIAYKTYVELKTRYRDRAGREKIILSRGDYDFNIESNSVISDTKRFEAIRLASSKAIDHFISKLSIEGIR